MKKSLLMLGAAAMVLASCTQNEVMEVAENRSIGFNSFVNNTTKAATEFTGTATSGDIYVIGYYGNNNGTLDQKVFVNELGSTNYYWQDGKDYIFGAYADGKGGKFDGTTFDATNQVLTFTNYAPDDAKDLVATISDKVTNVTASTQSEVNLTFKHMLAQVGFTFKTEVGTEYELNITGIQIEQAIKTATGTYTKEQSGDITINWEGTATAEGETSYAYGSISDLANAENKTAQEFKLVIPQTVDGSNLKVTFQATIKGVGLDNTSSPKKIAVVLPSIIWQAGYKYNYTTVINAENIIEDTYPIEFTVEEIPVWTDGGNQDLTAPTVQP